MIKHSSQTLTVDIDPIQYQQQIYNITTIQNTTFNTCLLQINIGDSIFTNFSSFCNDILKCYKKQDQKEKKYPYKS